MKQIKEVCELTGLSKRALQFYDEKGLLHVKRTKWNYRIYGEDDLFRIWLILVYKEMGFSLSEIMEMLDAEEDVSRGLIANKILEIEAEAMELERRRKFIEKVLMYGIPDREIEDIEKGEMTYADYVRLLSERI